MKILLSNASLLIRETYSYICKENQFLAIEDDLISYIGSERPEGCFDEEINLSGQLVMPGLINAHGHAAMTLLRNCGSGLPLHLWLSNAIWPTEELLRPIDIKHGVDMAILEMIASGTTAFVDMYDFPYAELESIANSGMVGHLTRVGICLDKSLDMKDCERFHQCVDFVKFSENLLSSTDEEKKETDYLETPITIKQALKDGRIVVDFSIHSQYLSTPKMVEEITSEAKKYNKIVQVHIAETNKEVMESMNQYGCTPVGYFDSHKALNSNVLASHCVHVTDHDLDILKANDVTIVYNPCSNMKLTSGEAPIASALSKSINIALGTDGCASNDNLDMFKEMHSAALLSCLQAGDASAVSASQILDMATINGAKAIRRKCGLIKEGYKADLIVLDLSKPNYYPKTDIASLLVYSANSRDVVYSFVDGKMLYDHGVYLTMDKNKIYDNFKKSCNHLGRKF